MKQPRTVPHFLVPVAALGTVVLTAENFGWIRPGVGTLTTAVCGFAIGWGFARHVQRWLALEPQEQVLSIPCPHCKGQPTLDIRVVRNACEKSFDGTVRCSGCGLHLHIALSAPVAMPVADVRAGGLRLIAERWANPTFRRLLAADWRRKQDGKS